MEQEDFFNDITPEQNPNPPIEDVIFISEMEFAYGLWLFEFDKSKKPLLNGLYRNGIVSRLETLGYYKRYRDNNSYIFIKEQYNIIQEVEPEMMKDEFFNLVKSISDILEFEYGEQLICVQPEKLRETFLRQSHLIFNETFLEHLTTHIKPILRDTKDEAFFFFKNQIIKVTKNGSQPLEYSAITKECIWRTQIIDHGFNYITNNENCHFGKFIINVSNNEPERLFAFFSAIGYLLHNFTEPSKGQAVIAYDEEITDIKNPMGGTGKGLLANAIKQLRNVVKVDGKRFDPQDKFRYQEIKEDTQVFWLDDAKSDLGFEVFHSILTDGMNIEHKHKTTFIIKPENSPKMFIPKNSIFNGNGTTNKRRQFIIEFSNHYSKQIKIGNEQPIINEHGCTFFDKNDWDLLEWNKFFSYMLDCVQKYLQDGLQSYVPKGLHKNRLIQSTNEDFYNWVEAQNFEVGKQYDTKETFSVFKNLYYPESDFKQRSFSNWLKYFADSKNWKLVIKSSSNIQYFSFSG